MNLNIYKQDGKFKVFKDGKTYSRLTPETFLELLKELIKE